ASIFFILLLALVVGLFYLRRWAKKRQDATGEIFPFASTALAALLIIPVVLFYALGSPLHLEYAEMGKFIMTGGINLNFSFFVLWFALTVYTAAYIGENVRAGILAVSRGQSEAAHSLGIRHTPTLRLVVIPQAMRVIIPPTISQFLNLTKNSSLAVIVAYEDIVNVFAGVALNNTGQALPIIAITVLLYGTLSLGTSAILNWYNKRVQLTER
ncbi:MAG: ABC transporter permease subunit, partial [Proteobacteria bacterium]|nr:ABC transporter permease subunit [Pseudomonadota bacterium]